MKTWIVDYVVGNTYKVKTVNAETAADAIKKARVKNIVDLKPVDVFETVFGEVLCGRCGAELECNECGDMPEICPKCGAFLSYSIYKEDHV